MAMQKDILAVLPKKVINSSYIINSGNWNGLQGNTSCMEILKTLVPRILEKTNIKIDAEFADIAGNALVWGLANQDQRSRLFTSETSPLLAIYSIYATIEQTMKRKKVLASAESIGIVIKMLRATDGYDEDQEVKMVMKNFYKYQTPSVMALTHILLFASSQSYIAKFLNALKEEYIINNDENILAFFEYLKKDNTFIGKWGK